MGTTHPEPRLTVSWPLAIWTVLAAGLSIWIAAFEIRHASVDVVYSDTWGYLHMIDGFLAGAFDPSEILKPHNQNRTAILVGVLAGSAQFDHFNQKNIENLSLVFAAITLANLLYLAYSLIRARPLAKGVVALIINLMLFSLVQWENLLLSINFVLFATMAFSVTSIVAMSRFLVGAHGQPMKLFLFALAVLTSELALLSMGGGIVVWIVNIVQIGLAIVLFQARAVVALLVYAALAFVSLSAYVWGLNAGGSLLLALSHPLDTFAFFTVGTGNSIVGMFDNQPVLWLDFIVGLFLNLIFLSVLVYYFRLERTERKQSLVLICLILLGLFEQILITYGRLPLGLMNAATARYSTLTVVAPAAALIFLTLYADASRVCRLLTYLTGSIILLFTVIGDRNELKMAASRQEYGRELQKILLDNKIGSEQQSRLEWESLSDIQSGNETLRKYRLSFYHRL